jgi:DNA-binding XRE family transcriptional regulator
MNEAKRRKLERAGWTVGSAADFLELSPEEARYVEMKLALTDALRTRRAAKHLTQTALAKQLGSSQSRVAKMEAGDPTVTVDLLMRSLLVLGASPRDIAHSISRPRRKRRVAA